MRTILLLVVALILGVASAMPRALHTFTGFIGVANRQSNSFSLINPQSDRVRNFSLPANSEPMYFGLSRAKGEIWVGDRASNSLLVYKARGSQISLDEALVTCPAGLFHSMITQADLKYPYIWTTCDDGKVTVVQDVTTRKTIKIIQVPAVARSQGAFPHDVTSNARYGFITYLAASSGVGFVGIYDTLQDFKQVKLLRTKEDPHVAIRDDSSLYIAAQGGEVVIVRPVPPFNVIRREVESSPHGVIINAQLTRAYITNIAGEGTNAFVVYDVQTNRKVDCPRVTTSFPGPHNPKTTLDGRKLYTTHTSSSVVSVFDIRGDGCLRPRSERILRTGAAPFGICTWPEPVPTIERGFSCLAV